MKRRILGIKLKDRRRNDEIRRKSELKEVMELYSRLLWNWAGHVARIRDNRKTKRILNGDQENAKDRLDDLKHVAETEWIHLANDKEAWKNLGHAYIRQWMNS